MKSKDKYTPVVEFAKKNGFVVVQEYCENPDNPRDDYAITTIVVTPNLYIKSEEDVSDIDAHMEEIAENELGIVNPLYMFVHSGVALATGPFSCPWDSGLVGYIYCLKEEVIKAGIATEANWKEEAQRCIDSELSLYNKYLSGDVYMVCKYHMDGEIEALGDIYGWESCLDIALDFGDSAKEGLTLTRECNEDRPYTEEESKKLVAFCMKATNASRLWTTAQLVGKLRKRYPEDPDIVTLSGFFTGLKQPEFEEESKLCLPRYMRR